MSRLRQLAPIVIAVAAVVLAVVQLPKLGGITPQAGNTRPCQAELAAAGTVPGTPFPDTESDETRITTTLVVTAPENGVLLLHPMIRVQARQSNDEVRAWIESIAANPKNHGAPNWGDFNAILEDTPATPDDVGLFPPETSIDKEAAAIATEQAGGAPLPAVTPPTSSRIATKIAADSRHGQQASDVSEIETTPVPRQGATPTPEPADTIKTIREHLTGSPRFTVRSGEVDMHISLLTTPLDKSTASAGGWQAKQDGQTVQFHIQGHPAYSVWHVRFCVEGMHILSAMPSPKLLDANQAVWRFDADDQPYGSDRQPPDGGLTVVTATQHPMWLRQSIASDPLGADVLFSWALMAPALLLLIGVWISRPERALEGLDWSHIENARSGLVAATMAVTRLAILGIGTRMLQVPDEKPLTEAGIEAFKQRSQEGVQLEIDLPAVLLLAFILVVIGVAFATVTMEAGVTARQRILHFAPVITFVGAIMALCAYVVSNFGWVAIRSPMVSALLVTGYFSFLLTAVSLWAQKISPLGNWMRLGLVLTGATGVLPCLAILLRMRNIISGPLDSVTNLVALLAAVWVTAVVATGFSLMAAALLPSQPEQSRSGILRHSHAPLAAVIVVVVVLIQWMVMRYNLEPFSERTMAEADPGNEWHGFFSRNMQEDVAAYLQTFLWPALNLLALLGPIGLVGLLSVLGRRATRPDWGDYEGWVRKILAFLFAAFVVGSQGEILGLQAPVALVFGFLLFVVVTSGVFQTIAGDSTFLHGKSAKEASASVSPDYQPEFWWLMSATPDPPGGQKEEPSTGANSLEPGWWDQACLAVSHGSLLALLPIGYFTVIVLGGQASGGVLLLNRFDPAGTLMVLAYEVVFWLVATFVFGAAYHYLPGPNGLIKGGALALAYIGANLGAAMLGVTGDPLWRVKSFQLLLFLMLLGVWLDNETFGVHWREQLEKSGLPIAIAAGRHLLPIISALAVVMAQLLNNNTQDAITSLITGEVGNAILSFGYALGESPKGP